jgi:polar amino acid transport system substrate-binding protein
LAQGSCDAIVMRLRCVFLLMILACLPAVQAAELRVVFGQSLAPFADERDGRGLEVDIIRAALEAVGHRIKVGFVPQARVPSALSSGDYDAAATLTPDSGLKAAYSEVYIHYLDYAITARGRFPAGLKMADLSSLRVVAFQNAGQYLGPEYAAMARSNPRYREQADQLSQVRMLFGGQTDVIIAERHIFEYQLARLRASRFPERPFEVDMFALFDKIPYRVAFRDAALRDQFNAGLAQIRKDGLLDRITRKYLSEETSR